MGARPPRLPIVPPREVQYVERAIVPQYVERAVRTGPEPIVDGPTLARVAALMARRVDAILSGWLIARVASSGALARFLEADPWMPPASATPRAKRRKIPGWNAATLKGQRSAAFVQAMQNPTEEQRERYRGVPTPPDIEISVEIPEGGRRPRVTARPSLPALTPIPPQRHDPDMSNPMLRSTIRGPAPRPNPRLNNIVRM